MSAASTQEASRSPFAPVLIGTIILQARAAWSAIIASAQPTLENAWLTNAQVQLYRRSTRYNAVLLAIGAFFVTQACTDWVSWQTRTAWWVGVSCVCLAIDVLGRRLDALQGDSLASIRARAHICIGTAIAFTAAWASMTVFLWVPGDEINHMILVLILACSIAGWTATGAVHPATAAAAFTIYAICLVGRLATAGSSLDQTLAALASIYVALMAGQIIAVALAARKMFTLEHERAGLVDGLQRAKEVSDRERARAMAAGRAKSQFLSNMNHELRTPMNAILGFSELIKHKSFGADVDKYAEYAEIIHDSGTHLLSLIDDMLDLAKIEGGRLSLRETSVDLKTIIADAIDGNETISTEANLSVAKRVSRGLPRLHADERAIRQIVGNLLSNGLKFTPAGGCVTVFAQIEPDGRLAFGVEDTGIGIAEEDQANVFERFGKGRHDVTTMDKGTGLGLAIVKGFAEAHDGEVRLESALGDGTRVTVYFPASRIDAQESLQKKAG